PEYALAGPASPGAAPFSLAAVQAGVAQARGQADLVFVNVQHTEAYQAEPLPEQVADFRAIIDAGADVVTGSQAHQPQVVEWYQGKPIFYGLGNLFFDQTWSPATRQSLIVRHYVYGGRLLSVEILPTTMDGDCQPYLAGGEERDEILRTVLPGQ
ncbi:MAG TPA: CapA family protein, partial [Anaerolineae bacterium]|nr:CapA family protein [Anaerolineae bacterium]